MTQFGTLKQSSNLHWNRDRRASIHGFKSEILFLSEWVRTDNFVKDEYSYICIYIYTYYEFTFYRYSEGENMLCDTIKKLKTS